jgi:hypothetical protein
MNEVFFELNNNMQDFSRNTINFEGVPEQARNFVVGILNTIVIGITLFSWFIINFFLMIIAVLIKYSQYNTAIEVKL